jgi:Tfp pilus assembly protein PilE
MYLNRRGFTIVGTMVTVVILAILLAISFVSINSLSSFKKNTKTKSIVSNLNMAVEEYKVGAGEWFEIAGPMNLKPSDMSISNHDEVLWQTQAINAMKQSVGARFLIERNGSLIKEFSTSSMENIKKFRTVDYTGFVLSENESTVSNAVVLSASSSTIDDKLFIAYDAWDNPIHFIPGHHSDKTLASRNMPQFISAGENGILESMPYRFDKTGTFQQKAGSSVYYNGRNYIRIADETSIPTSSFVVSDSEWKEIQSDDIR